MIKWILVLCLALTPVTAGAGELHDWLLDGPTRHEDVIHRQLDKQAYFIERRISVEVDRSPHRNFKIDWDIHILSITLIKSDDVVIGNPGTYFDLRQFHYAMYAGVEAFEVHWHLFDYDDDGTVDEWWRDFRVHLSDGSIFEPDHPDESLRSIMAQWRWPPREQAQAAYDHEVMFWDTYRNK